MAGISGAGHTVDPSHPAAVGSSAAVGRQGSRSRARDPGVLRPSQETTAAGRQDPAGAQSVADSVRDQFPFNSNQLRAAAVSTWSPGCSYYSPLGVNARRGTRAAAPSVSLSHIVFYVASATDVT